MPLLVLYGNLASRVVSPPMIAKKLGGAAHIVVCYIELDGNSYTLNCDS